MSMKVFAVGPWQRFLILFESFKFVYIRKRRKQNVNRQMIMQWFRFRSDNLNSIQNDWTVIWFAKKRRTKTASHWPQKVDWTNWNKVEKQQNQLCQLRRLEICLPSNKSVHDEWSAKWFLIKFHLFACVVGLLSDQLTKNELMDEEELFLFLSALPGPLCVIKWTFIYA